jgi:hypothetical protein
MDINIKECEYLVDRYLDAIHSNSKFVKVVEYKLKSAIGLRPPYYQSFIIPTDRDEAMQKIYRWLHWSGNSHLNII